MDRKPRVSFLMPHRWLTTDKEFLVENLKRQFLRDWGPDHEWELEGIPAYRVKMICHSVKPIREELNKTVVQKALKSFFPIGRCVAVDNEFVQKNLKKSLPVLEVQVYF